MTAELLKRIMAGLLIATGAFHIAFAQFGDAGDLKYGLTLFGIAYFLLGVFLIPGKRTAVLTAMVMTALGLGLGGQNYLNTGGGSPVLLVFFAIDVLALIAGGLWLVKTKSAAKP
jgi:hypothetical protein